MRRESPPVVVLASPAPPATQALRLCNKCSAAHNCTERSIAECSFGKRGRFGGPRIVAKCAGIRECCDTRHSGHWDRDNFPPRSDRCFRLDAVWAVAQSWAAVSEAALSVVAWLARESPRIRVDRNKLVGFGERFAFHNYAGHLSSSWSPAGCRRSGHTTAPDSGIAAKPHRRRSYCLACSKIHLTNVCEGIDENEIILFLSFKKHEYLWDRENGNGDEVKREWHFKHWMWHHRIYYSIFNICHAAMTSLCVWHQPINFRYPSLMARRNNRQIIWRQALRRLMIRAAHLVRDLRALKGPGTNWPPKIWPIAYPKSKVRELLSLTRFCLLSEQQSHLVCARQRTYA